MDELRGKVIQKIPPAPLHVQTGIVKVIVDEMETREPECVKQWLQSLKVQRQLMHGGAFQGNDSRKIMSHAESISDYCDDAQWCQLSKYVQVLMDFDSIVRCCYSRRLLPGTESRIQAFKMSYLSAGLPVTTKAHCVFHHLWEYVSFTQRGLALDSEQTHEAVHYHFNRLWREGGYYVREAQSEVCQEKLFRAVLNYNGSNL